MLKLFILARIISKADFGIVAIATMVLGFTEIFANMGLATGLIHKQDITRQQYSSVFWLNLMLSGVLYGLLCAVTPLVADYYHIAELRKVIPLMGLTLVINAFGKMFYTFKTRELDFRFIAIVEIVAVLLGVLLTVVLALLGFGVYSLVYGSLLQAVLSHGVYALFGIFHYRILFHFRISEIVDIAKIGGYQLGMQVVDYVASKLDVFLVGRFFSQEVLGVYNLAKELLYKAIQLVTPIVSNVAAPAFARFQEDKPLMRQSYSKVLSLLSFVNFPVFAAFFFFAEPITLLLYGENMLDMVWFVRVLSLWGLFQSVGSPASILMVSLGRTDLGLVWTLVRVSVTLVATMVACRISIEAMAWAQVIIAFIFLFAYWRMMVYAMIRLPLKDYLRSVAYPLLAIAVAAVVVIPVLWLAHSLDGGMRLVLLWGDLVLAALVYVAFYWFTRRGYLMDFCKMIFRR